MGVNIIISSEISNEYFKVIDLEDAAVANLTHSPEACFTLFERG